MRKRNVFIPFRLTDEEADKLNDLVKRSGLSREEYLRQLIRGLEPREAPPTDYYGMMTELHQIGHNLNQIVRKAHTLNVIDVQRYDEAVAQFKKVVEEITEAVILPSERSSK